LNKFDNPIGEFTTREEPVVTVIVSKIPADAAATKTDRSKKIPA
jgi:hypothetical protein